MGKKILKNLQLVAVVFIFAGFCVAVTAEKHFSCGFVLGIVIVVAGGIISLLAPNDPNER